MAWDRVEQLVEADVTFLRARLKAPPIWDPELHTRLRKTGVGGSLFFFSPRAGPCKEESGLAARAERAEASVF